MNEKKKTGRINAIVAIDTNCCIGKGNELPWKKLKPDLKFFKETTSGSPVIMGRKTYESIGRPLPKRENIVITRDTEKRIEGCHVVNSIESAIELAKSFNTDDIFIIGGAQIYKEAFNLIERLYVTIIDIKVEGGDAYFPDFEMNLFSVYEKLVEPTYDEDTGYTYSIIYLEKLQ